MTKTKAILVAIAFSLAFTTNLMARNPFTLKFVAKDNVAIEKLIVRNISRTCKDTVLLAGETLSLPTIGNAKPNGYGLESNIRKGKQSNKHLAMIKSSDVFCFAEGDSLQYTAYANGYAKTTVGDKPTTDHTYQLEMEIPVVSFAVISDIHFGSSTGSGAMYKVPNALKNISSKTPLIDAIFVVGDLTDTGIAKQYDQLLTVFNDTSYLPSSVRKVYMMGNHDNYQQDGQATYLAKLGQDLDQYIEINGLPFITISQRAGSNSGSGETSYPLESQNFLRNSLIAAARDYPAKPIFVFTHVAPLGTTYGSRRGDYGNNNGWGMPILTPILKEYPQAIVFSGHSHFPIGNPNSINQDSAFTTINTGSTTYGEVQEGLVDKGIHPEAYQDITEGHIVNVMANGDVILNRWDTFRNEEILPEWRVNAPHDGTQFVYKSNRMGLPKPYFGPEASLTVLANDSSCTVTFPQAIDDDFVQHYSVDVYKGKSKISSYNVFSQFYLNSETPTTLSTPTMSGLKPNTQYKVKVFAYDCFENASKPLENTFRTAKR